MSWIVFRYTLLLLVFLVSEMWLVVMIFWLLAFSIMLVIRLKSLWYQFLISISCFIIIRISVTWYQNVYFSQGNIAPVSTLSGGRLGYYGHLVITNKGINGRYEVRFPDGSEWFFRSQEFYRLGDHLFVTANVRRGLVYSSFLLSSGGLAGIVGRGSGYEFNYPYRLMMKGIQGDLYESQSLNLHQYNESDRLSVVRNGLHDLITQSLGSGQTAALTQGMLVGDRSLFTKSEYQMFIDSGLVHLIAVSGGNIVMLVTFLAFILFWIPYYSRIVVMLVMVVLYAMICGMDSSVFRAAIMGGLSLFALLVGRGVDIRRALQLAWLSMLIVNPYYLVYDVGFLLSFCAVIGLVVLTPKFTISAAPDINHKKKLTRIWTVWGGITYCFRQIWNWYLVPSCAATLGVLPVILFFMGSINIVGVLANLLVVPLVPLVMVIGFLVALCVPRVVLSPLVWLQHQMVGYIFGVGELTARYGLYLDVHIGRVKLLCLVIGLAWLGREMTRVPKDTHTTQTDDQGDTRITLDHYLKGIS